MYRNKWWRCLGIWWEINIQVNSKQKLRELWVSRIFQTPETSTFLSLLLIAISLLDFVVPVLLPISSIVYVKTYVYVNKQKFQNTTLYFSNHSLYTVHHIFNEIFMCIRKLLSILPLINFHKAMKFPSNMAQN